MIYVNKIANRITFEKKTGYYLEILTPETIKLLRSTRNKIANNENGEYVPHLETTFRNYWSSINTLHYC